MKRAMIIVVVLLCSYCASLGDAPMSGEWPKITREVEEALPRASGAFVGILEFFDVDRESENITMASGRIIPTDAVWGKRPSGPIELGRRAFMHAGSGPGMDHWMPFVFLLDAGRRSVSVVVVYLDTDGEVDILNVIVTEHGGVSRARADLLQIREFELQSCCKELRKALVDTVGAGDSSEMLWSYALRRLFRLSKTPVQRFETVFNERLQEAAIADRLDYAVKLLISNGFSRSVEIVPPAERGDQADRTLKWVVGGATDGRMLRDKFLGAFEEAGNAEVAYAAVIALTKDDRATHVEWTEDELNVIRRRIGMAWGDPKHPVHRLDEQRARSVKARLNEVLGFDERRWIDRTP